MVDQLELQEMETTGSSSSAKNGGRRLTRVVLAVLAALVIGGVIGWLVGQSGDSPDTPSDAMLETVDAWVAAVEGQDAGDVAALYSEDAVWHDEALESTYRGREAVRFAYDTAFGQIEVRVDRLAVIGDTAVMRWIFTDAGDLDLAGISILEFDGDVIVAESLYYDCAQSPVAATACANLP